MRKVDTRKLPIKALQQLRYDVIKLHQESFTYKLISKTLNVSLSLCGSIVKIINLKAKKE